MTWNDVVIQIAQTLIGLVIAFAIPYAFSVLRGLVKNERVAHYLDLAEKYITQSVAMVNQTFVDSLKAEGKFDLDAQQKAFDLAKENWAEMMNDEMKVVVVNEIGDLEAWLTTKIEAAVSNNKKEHAKEAEEA